MNMSLYAVIDYLKDHWKILVAGILVGFALVAIIFTLPLVKINHEETHTDYDIETKQESYVANEPYTTLELKERTKVIASGFYKVVPSGIVIPFIIDKSGSRLVGRFENEIQGSFNVLGVSNNLIWETLGASGTIDLPLPSGEYTARFRENLMWGEDCYIHLAIVWTEAEQVTRYNQVIKYNEVPVKVERQQTTITKENISVWKYLFRSN
ncbi:hypothetical protein ACFLXL_03225 [Chloroflexota bacterium]